LSSFSAKLDTFRFINLDEKCWKYDIYKKY